MGFVGVCGMELCHTRRVSTSRVLVCLVRFSMTMVFHDGGIIAVFARGSGSLSRKDSDPQNLNCIDPKETILHRNKSVGDAVNKRPQFETAQNEGIVVRFMSPKMVSNESCFMSPNRRM
jgi:hypothetical protein